ncbi:MAG TPA: hypothetical protein VFV43_09120 [Limnobacter sp.]|nr:hypothetical protein [Limnobacter sp.]
MIIVKPESITDAKLTATNVPEMDHPAWNSATTYATGAMVIYNHRIYESLQNSNLNNQPDVSPAFWLDTGATNRFRMFDVVVATQTSNPNNIDVTITPGVAITAVVLFNVDAASIRVVGNTPSMGDFYDRTIQLQDYSAINGWFSYFYAPVGERLRSEIAFLDIPAIGGANYRVLIDNGTETAFCGELILGQQIELGITGFGAQVGIINYSRKEVDQFGNFVIVPRRFASKGNFDVLIDSGRNAFVKRRLTEIKDIPVVFIGDENRAETIIYGFYKDFNIVIEGPVKSMCNLDVEGLT